jgi:CDP-paratose 2-epimerase
VIEWFRPGEHARVERALLDLRALGVNELRTGVSWADWHSPEGEGWYSWLLPRLAKDLNVLPCFVYTPPSLGVAAKTSSPPRQPKLYADFVDVMITRFGVHFEWLELWNEPNNLNDWDWRLDPMWNVFCEMVGGAAHWAQRRGKKTVLAGMCPTDANWLRLVAERGVLEHIDAVGVHGFPGTWEYEGESWAENVAKVREVLERYGHGPEIWITEAGYSTWQHDETEQVRVFLGLLEAPVERVYWYSAHDLDPKLPHQDGFHKDERHYHFGLKRADGTPKLLFRLWQEGGVAGVRAAAPLLTSVRVSDAERPVLITGGAGFVGTNLAHRLLESGRPVLIFDNLSRPGVERNLRWLKGAHGAGLGVDIADIRDPYRLREAASSASQVFHLAAQVAVTTSLVSPVDDFEINGRGTLNLLEALRAQEAPPPLIFTSTNKVYGGLDDLSLRRQGRRYEPDDPLLRASGLSEERPLDFHSPYGCSKGAADQYVLDYGRSFGLPVVVLRMSCIYGPHQFGSEDQGWVAHFLIRALRGEPITLYGDGMQVRDILFVSDLIDALLLAQERVEALAGQAFNIGGGPENSLGLLELVELIGELQGRRPEVGFGAWRTGDQRYYVSDTGKFREATGWAPRVRVRQGVARLHDWLLEHRGLSARELAAGKVAS